MQHSGPAGPELTRGAVTMSAARASVLAELRTHRGLCTVRDLAEALDLHANTVREHLDALVENRLVVRTQRRPVGRGRPALLYRAVHDAGDVARDYEVLAEVLAAHIATQPDVRENALRAGRTWGERMAEQAPSAADVVVLLDELGFDPGAPDHTGSVVLRSCPVLDVARRHPDVVCTAHLGMAQALVSAGGQATEGMSLEPMGAEGGCLLRLPHLRQDARRRAGVTSA